MVSSKGPPPNASGLQGLIKLGLIPRSQSSLVISLIPALLKRSHLRPSQAFHMLSKTSSMEMPPHNSPVPSTASHMVMGLACSIL